MQIGISSAAVQKNPMPNGISLEKSDHPGINYEAIPIIRKADSERRNLQVEGENVTFWAATETAAEVGESSCP